MQLSFAVTKLPALTGVSTYMTSQQGALIRGVPSLNLQDPEPNTFEAFTLTERLRTRN